MSGPLLGGTRPRWYRLCGVSDAQVIEAPADAAVVETDDDVVLADLLVEEVSIDGMCGVY